MPDIKNHENNNLTKRKIITQLIYPLSIIFLSATMIVVMTLSIIPSLFSSYKNLFAGRRADISFWTLIAMDAGSFAASRYGLVTGLFSVIAYFIYRGSKRR